MGFGSSSSIPGDGVGPINLTGLPDMAFDVVEDGILQSISFTFSVAADYSRSGGHTDHVRANVYSAPANSNVFTLLAATDPIGPLNASSVFSTIKSAVNAPVYQGTRLMLVVSAIDTDFASSPCGSGITPTPPTERLSGHVSAGVAIE